MWEMTPVLPPVLELSHYETRNHAFAPATVWVLDGAFLRIKDDKGPPRTIALNTVVEVRLEYAPTRPEPNRYRCRLVLWGGVAVEFFNRTYRGVMDFADTSVEYGTFVRALLAALARHNPTCRFLAGASEGTYVLNVAILVLLAVVLVGALVFFLTVGLLWVALLKVLLIVYYLPTALKWAKRNRPRGFLSDAIPPNLLPA